MPVLTIDVNHLVAAVQWDGQALRGWVEASEEVFVVGEELYVGQALLDFDPLGMASVVLPATSGSLLYRLRLFYRDVDRAGRSFASRWFALTTDQAIEDVIF